MSLRIGSLFTGTGALDLAVMDVYDAEVVWHSQYEPPDKNGREDKNQYAAKILARHWPNTPNLGDITKVDWQAVIEEHGPIDILTGGFPCQDVSSAGRRAGLTPDSRSGLWNHMAHAVSVLQPKLVVIENVEGLLSAPAASVLEPCPWCVGDGGDEPVLRALGAVLGDLATLGFDAEWGRFEASDVGAPHRRRRIIIRAWPAAADTTTADQGRLRRGGGAAEPAGRPEPCHGHRTPADASDLGHERGGGARGRRDGSTDRGIAAADAGRVGRQGQRGDTRSNAGWEAATVVGCGSTGSREASTHAERLVPGNNSELPAGRDAVQRGIRDDAPRCGEAAAHTPSDGRHEGRTEPARQQGRPDAPKRRVAAPAHADGLGQRADVLDLRPGQPDLDWGDYEPAIRRWERILGRPAPWPTDAAGRLSPVFTEWLMGLPDGWVTDTPGLTRAAMLRALGNGVVRQQAAAALRLLHQRADLDAMAA